MVAPSGGPITLHKLVALEYVLEDGGGELVADSKDEGPLVYVHGTGHLLPGLEQALEGKSAGQHFRVELSPHEGYGPRDDELVLVVQRTQFDDPERIEVGMRIQLESPEGKHAATVTDVEGEDVTLDANHPLAGMTLCFEVTILEVRDATEQEIDAGGVPEAAE